MLFDSSDEETEEVSLRTPDESSSEETEDSDLHNEVETRLGVGVPDDDSDSSSSRSSSSDVSLRDIKKQNEQIISLLQDIKNSRDTGNNSNNTGGDPTELL